MKKEENRLIGFTCAYTPIQLISAAGYTPYRVMPTGNAPEQAGLLLHDNMCPHVKRVLDRALANDLPELEGMIFINSCDAMRRLSDAWKKARPDDKVILLDLPSVNNKASVSFFAKECSRLSETLGMWNDAKISTEDIKKSIVLYNELAGILDQLRERNRKKTLTGGSTKLQETYNLASTKPVEEVLDAAKKILKEDQPASEEKDGVPVYLFGNVLPDTEAFKLFEACGVHIADNDLCTGSRLFNPVAKGKNENLFLSLSQSIFSKPPCARTFDPINPMGIAEHVLNRAKECGAQGVISYTLKFCDPYLARIPVVRSVLQDSSLPFLLLEGDCTMGSIGQQQTRIEAFIEMLR